MKYWLEKTYPSNRDQGDFTSLLLSPIVDARGADIYSNMRKVSPGDIIFHLDQDSNEFVGYSEVADSFNHIQINGINHYSIDLENFKPFDNSINVDNFLTNQNNQTLLTQIKTIEHKEVFYQTRNNQFYIKQGGYLTNLDERIVELIDPNIDYKPLDPIIDDEEKSFPEGKIKYRLHKHKERSKKLIKLAKNNFKQNNNGRLFCQVCNFDFVKKYGPIGEGFIEAHHMLPISEIDEHHETDINDIILLCSNCHRMIHRKRPWLSINNLQSLI